MKKFTQQVLIVGAAEMAIVGAVGGVNLLGQVSADPTSCIGVTASCRQVDINGSQSRGTVVCQPIGPKAGAMCRELARKPA